MPVDTMEPESTFQSTLSMRRATKNVRLAHVGGFISIHALHEESDPRKSNDETKDMTFQSTLSMRRATHAHVRHRRCRVISIHALHEESD